MPAKSGQSTRTFRLHEVLSTMPRTTSKHNSSAPAPQRSPLVCRMQAYYEPLLQTYSKAFVGLKQTATVAPGVWESCNSRLEGKHLSRAHAAHTA